MAFEEEVPTHEQFIELVKKNNPHADIDLISKAYNLAESIHKGQLRSSGEPFFVHPLSVAVILVELRADTATICAALLHDTVEDTTTSIDTIMKEFGSEIAELVEGVTKIQTILFPTKEEYQAENLRKILLATTKDVRVMLIRLADRLHNMRTLDTLREDKRKRIAQETLEIYAPIAHKLGIRMIKGPLEDLAFRHLKPTTYRRLKAQIAEKRTLREKVTKDIVNELKDTLKKEGIDAEVFGRAKYFYSIYKKMIAKDREIDQIYDLIAIRIVTKTIPECYNALEIVHNKYPPEKGRLKDFIAHPKANEYQSIHTTVNYGKKQLEVQIRTVEMHHIAEEGIAAHWRYKGTERDKQFDQKIAWLKQILDWKRRTKSAIGFVENLRIDLFENEIIVFTPKGDPISLPEGATPIDFAYEVHTGIGNRCSKSKVNEKLVPLDFELNSGDVVEIITQKNAFPSRSWLNFVKTKKAKNKIRAVLGIEVEHKPKEARLRQEAAEAQKLERRIINLEDYVLVVGRPEWAKHLKVSKCCRPDIGEDITGVKTKEGKITVHKTECPNLASIQEDRLIKLEWKEIEDRTFFKLKTFINDRPGVLAEILNLLAKEKLDVKSVNSRIRKRKIILSFKIKMISGEEQEELVEKVKKIGDVNDAKVSLEV
ncbi:RelA/SpoT family protein [Thermoproteota archaeon]